MSSRYTQLFYTDFSHFTGQLLHDFTDGLPAQDTPDPEFAALWAAVGIVLGMKRMISMLQQFTSLRKLLRGYLTLPKGQELLKDDDHDLALEVGSVLHRFSLEVQRSGERDELQHKYTAYLERIERIYHNLRQELQESTIADEEFNNEVEMLCLQSFYTLSRLQRM